MKIEFATCERKYALKNIQKVYPNKTLEDKNVVAELLDLVEKDIIRIQDPMMYGNRIGIIPSTNWDEKYRTRVIELGTVITNFAGIKGAITKEGRWII